MQRASDATEPNVARGLVFAAERSRRILVGVGATALDEAG
jgi:hypothetical protein